MKRREFIVTTACAGLGLAIGMPGGAESKALFESRPKLAAFHHPGFNYPRGGCTESGSALFDNGPRGKDPFGFALQS